MYIYMYTEEAAGGGRRGGGGAGSRGITLSRPLRQQVTSVTRYNRLQVSYERTTYECRNEARQGIPPALRVGAERPFEYP